MAVVHSKCGRCGRQTSVTPYVPRFPATLDSGMVRLCVGCLHTAREEEKRREVWDGLPRVVEKS